MRYLEQITAQRAADMISRFFARKPKKPVEVAAGVYECPTCLVFTDRPEKHRHEEIA